MLSEALVGAPQEVMQCIPYLFVALLFFLNKALVGAPYSVLFVLAHATAATALACGKIDNQPSDH